MFIIEVTYIKPIEEVDQHLAAHRAYLAELRDAGKLIVSGRKNPPTGGIIIARAENLEAAQQMIEADPFYKAQVAKFDVTEFGPKIFHPDFSGFVD
jgi:uncharacterized protein YciI